MNARDVMVHDVVTVGPDEDVSKAVQLLVNHDISALPVVDGELRVIGILSEADLLHREKLGTEKHRAWWLEAITPASMLAMDYAKSHGRKVAELMSEHVISANEDTSLSELANLLEKHRIKRLPILKDGKIVGIVSRANLIQALASAPSQPEKDQLADRGIRSAILARGWRSNLGPTLASAISSFPMAWCIFGASLDPRKNIRHSSLSLIAYPVYAKSRMK